MAKVFEDFVVAIEADGEDGLAARVSKAPYEAPRHRARLPLSADQFGGVLAVLENMVLGPGTCRHAGAHEKECADLSPAEFGAALFETLFSGGVRDSFLTCVGRMDAAKTGLRLRLAFDPSDPATVRIAALPWELLYREETRDFLVLDPRTPLVRSFALPRLTIARAPLSTLHVLVASPTPEGPQALAGETELRLMDAARERSERLAIDRITVRTLDELHEALRQRPVEVLHVIAHGETDPATGEGKVLLEDRDGGLAPVCGELLARSLKVAPDLRLVVLNACETGRLPWQPGHDPFSGVASALLMAGVPAVVAMQLPISDEAALAFSGAFYAALADGDPLEAATVEGRMAIDRQGGISWEWATPVLYLGVDHGQLVVSEKSPLPELHAKARKLLAVRAYGAARQMLEKAVEADPLDPDAHYLLALARLEGRRPRFLSPAQARSVEQPVSHAAALAPDRAHYLILLAVLKEGFYASNHLLVPPPSPRALLARAQELGVDQASLEELKHHVPSDHVLAQLA